MFRNNILKKLISFLLILTLVTGCVSPRAITYSPIDLQQKIRTGKLIQQGDRVIIENKDNKLFDFEVVSVNQEQVIGKKATVNIDEIITIEIYQSDSAKDLSLFLGILVAGVFILLISVMAPPPG